jgi:hypothetical protein
VRRILAAVTLLLAMCAANVPGVLSAESSTSPTTVHVAAHDYHNYSTRECDAHDYH